MIIYQFITPALHISFSYSLSRAVLVHSGSCGYRGGGSSAKGGRSRHVYVALSKWIIITFALSIYGFISWCSKGCRSRFFFFFWIWCCKNTWQPPRILVCDTARFKTRYFWNTYKTYFGICLIATCSVPLTVDIFNPPIKLLRNYPWAFLFSSQERRKFFVEIYLRFGSCYPKSFSCTIFFDVDSKWEEWCQVCSRMPIFRT